jgi:V-type H+-transporting ATPase subunit C
VKEFYKSYEELSPMVVPRSATKLAADDEFNLFAVTTFKKHSNDFVHKCREKRWTPREYKYKEGGKEEEAKEADQLAKDEKKLWGEALRLGRTGYSESAMIWIHVLALRVFVETVLRYGLPLDFVCGIVQVRYHPEPMLKLDHILTHDRPTQKQQRRQSQTLTPRTRT